MAAHRRAKREGVHLVVLPGASLRVCRLTGLGAVLEFGDTRGTGRGVFPYDVPRSRRPG